MRVFVTGATGFVGSAVVKELIGAGHKVLGLVRSDAAADALGKVGVDVHRGSIYDLESLKRGAAAADGVIHTAFNHDFSKFKENCETDRQVIKALGAALAGSGRPLLVTSGTGLISLGRPSTEDDMPAASATGSPRVASEEAADAVAAEGGNVALVRLPPSVHGDGDHGFVPLLIGVAREKGVAAYVGEGQNLWPAVHRFDAAVLYRLALEKSLNASRAPRAVRFHGVAEEGVAFKKIAEAIGAGLGVPVMSKSADEAAAHFGWFAHFAALNSPALSKQTQQKLNWHPIQTGLIADLQKAPSYFAP